MKFYMIKDSEGWYGPTLFRTEEGARERISSNMNCSSWEGVESFEILRIDTEEKLIETIETIHR